MSRALCPSCQHQVRWGDLFCGRCGNPLTLPDSSERLQNLLILIRKLIDERAWAALDVELAALGKQLRGHAELRFPLSRSIRWLEQSVLGLKLGVGLPRFLQVSKAVLRAVPEEAMIELRRERQRFNEFTLGVLAVNTELMEGRQAKNEPLRNWLTRWAEHSGLTIDEAEHFVYMTPEYWVRLAELLKPQTIPVITPVVQLAQARAAMRKQKPEESRKTFEMLLEADPYSHKVLEGLAALHALNQRPDYAVEYYRRAADCPGADALVYNSLASTLLSLPAPTTAQLEEALVMAQRAAELAFIPAYIATLAQARIRLGHMVRALEAIRDGLRLSPDHTTLRELLNQISTFLAQRDQASGSHDRAGMLPSAEHSVDPLAILSELEDAPAVALDGVALTAYSAGHQSVQLLDLELGGARGMDDSPPEELSATDLDFRSDPWMDTDKSERKPLSAARRDRDRFPSDWTLNSASTSMRLGDSLP